MRGYYGILTYLNKEALHMYNESMSDDYSPRQYSQKGRFSQDGELINVSSLNFSGNSLLQFQIVYQKKEKEYKSPFFMFINIVPAGKNGTNKTYITEQKISFRFEYAKALELGYALRVHGSGNGERFGAHTFFADPSKANCIGENTELRKGKRLMVNSSVDNRDKNKRIVILSADRGTGQGGEKDKAVTYCMNMYEALAIADSLLFLAQQARDMHHKHMLQITRSAFVNTNYNRQ